MTAQRYTIGIDLGTTFSSLAYVDEDGRLESLRLPQGGFALASAVYFKSENEVLVGNEALKFAPIDASKVALEFKRRMGDSSFEFECYGKTYRPEELSAMVLRRLLDAATEQLGPIDEAVISVPFVFDEKRRRATQDAATIAGLKNVDLVDEPVAAGLAYAQTLFQGGLFGDEELDELFGGSTRLLVYDLGGGTFDATIMELGEDGVFEVLATAGDERLGGKDWDQVLLEIVCQEYQKATSIDPRNDPELLNDLRLRAIEAKKTLSKRPRIDFVFTHDGTKHTILLKRADFERAAQHLVVRTTDTIGEMLASKDMAWNYVDNVLMVGGSSRMPMVRKAMEMASRRQLDMSLPPDTAIAKGAALYSAYKRGDHNMKVNDVVTVNSHALGLMVKDEKHGNRIVNDVLLEVNQPTLTEVVREYATGDSAKALSLVVLQGNDPDPNMCVRLGRVRIAGLPTTTPQRPKIRVSYYYREDGILAVEGVVQQSGGKELKKAKTEIVVEGKMSDQDVAAAVVTLRGIDIE